MTLLNKEEVFYYSGKTRASLNAAVASQQIQDVERATFLKYLGMDLYYDLIADKIDYSSTAMFSLSTAYTTGNLVKYLGIIYKATASSTGVVPEMDSDKWTQAPKFTNTCFEALWLEIRRWLCLTVVNNVLPSVAVQLDDRGLTMRSGQDFEPARIREHDMYVQGLNQDINLCWGNFIEWLNNKTTCTFDIYTMPCFGNLKQNTPIAGRSIPNIY